MRRAGSVSILLILFLSAVIGSGTFLSSPQHESIGAAPSSLRAENIEFHGVHGWFSGSVSNENCALLTHGVRANQTKPNVNDRSWACRLMF